MTPRISIVVPTFARPERLRDCLEACCHLQFDGAFEVVVVDDGSPSSMAPVVAEVSNRLPVTLVTQSQSGPGGARNAGVAAAHGRYIAFLDDDCRPAVDWLTVIVRELDRDPAQLVGGRVENALTSNPYSEASERIGQFVYGYNQRPTAHEPFFTTNNIALSAELFRSVGGFTAAIPSATAEDKDFCDRWRARGLALAPVPAAVVYHSHDLTFTRFVRQHFNYGRGILAFRLLRRSRARSQPSIERRRAPRASKHTSLVPEPLAFYRELVLSPIYARGVRRGAGLAALIFVSQLATLAGATREALRWRDLAKARAHAEV